MTTLLETARLRFRPFAATDATTVAPWMMDAEVQRFLPNGRDHSMAQVGARVARYMAHQAQYGYSRQIMFDRATGEAVGDAGLLYLPDSQETELGYRLLKSHWGKGLASEAARRWLDYAFGELGLPEVIAFAHPDNIGSVRVMQKCGFTFLREDTVAGMDVVVYVTRA